MVLKEKKIKNKNIATKFIGCLTKKGKKVVAQKIFNKSVENVSKTLNIKSGVLMKKIVQNLGVIVELRKVKIRRNNFLVPIPINSRRRNYTIIKRILNVIHKNILKTSLDNKLSKELISIITRKNSFSISEKDQMLKEAYKNKSNIHFRW
jgi:small subunit ribosomal protein S7